MNFQVLTPFIREASKSGNSKIKTAADAMLDQVMEAQEAEEVNQPTLKQETNNKALDVKKKDEVDTKINTWMPDIVYKTDIESDFGKAASAYIADISISLLPKDTQDNIFKLLPDADKSQKVTQYGMTVSELLPKVDTHNYKLAKSHITEKINKEGKKAMGNELHDIINRKYLLLINDNLVDGHHALALANILGITCSLKVLDLNPIRFQIKKANTLFDLLRHE